MSNTINDFKVGFQERYQDILHKTLISRKIASFGLKSHLKWGTTVTRPILETAKLRVRDVTRYSDRTINGLTDSNETLVINQQKAVDFALDSWDELQAGPLQLGQSAGKEAAFILKEYMDGQLLAEVANAHATFTGVDIGGSAGPITLAAGSSSNVANTFTNLFAKLRTNKVNDTGRLAVCLDPYHIAIIEQELIGKDIDMAASVFKNGYVGNVLNFEMYMSLNNRSSASLGIATNPSADDTVSINGVTFTFVAAPSDPGDVDIGSNAAGSVDNLVAAINGTGTPGATTYIELSEADRATLVNAGVTATDNTTSILVTAYGRMTLAETFTDATDAWGNQTINSFAGVKGSIDMVAQQDVSPDLRKEPKQRTVNVLTDSLYGIKTFADGKQKFLDLQLKA